MAHWCVRTMEALMSVLLSPRYRSSRKDNAAFSPPDEKCTAYEMSAMVQRWSRMKFLAK